EIIAEDFFDLPLPPAIEKLRDRGVVVIPHGIGLSLGSAEPPCPLRLKSLANLARRVHAPLVSEHLAFVRAGGIESGHLLPLPRTREAVEVVVANIRIAMDYLEMPLALENITTMFQWPGADMEEADFLNEILDRSGARLLLDVENLHANAENHGGDARALVDRLPLERIAYVHVAGGVGRDGLYHDTHTQPTPSPVLDLLEYLGSRAEVPGTLLERDGNFPCEEDLHAELDAIADAVKRGQHHRSGIAVPG
ncbi:MAG: DUF692 domain-containing protein, partial [Gemmataceae bacterium]